MRRFEIFIVDYDLASCSLISSEIASQPGAKRDRYLSVSETIPNELMILGRKYD
jgi:hypothetical protein